jgi:magnesium-transporting ATPase (P-type)
VQVCCVFAGRSLRRALFTSSPFGNRIILLGVAVVVVLQVLFTYAGFMQTAFDTVAISGTAWLAILAIGVGAMVVMDLVGVILRRLHID